MLVYVRLHLVLTKSCTVHEEWNICKKDSKNSTFKKESKCNIYFKLENTCNKESKGNGFVTESQFKMLVCVFRVCLPLG